MESGVGIDRKSNSTIPKVGRWPSKSMTRQTVEKFAESQIHHITSITNSMGIELTRSLHADAVMKVPGGDTGKGQGKC